MEPGALEDLFILNATTLAALGSILGGLSGTIAFLVRQLLKSKREEIDTLKEEVSEMRKERDFFRDIALHKETP